MLHLQAFNLFLKLLCKARRLWLEFSEVFLSLAAPFNQNNSLGLRSIILGIQPGRRVRRHSWSALSTLLVSLSYTALSINTCMPIFLLTKQCSNVKSMIIQSYSVRFLVQTTLLIFIPSIYAQFNVCTVETNILCQSIEAPVGYLQSHFSLYQ